MYLAAQRVRTPGGGTGVNAFLYRHGDLELPKDARGAIDVEAVATRAPGSLVADSIEIAPGGNAVESYLDIAAADETEPAAIVAALDRFERGEFDATPAIAIAHLGARDHNLAADFRALRSRVLELLEREVARRPERPRLIAVGTRDSEGWLYELEPRSATRLQEALGDEWTPPRVRITDATIHDFQALSPFDLFESIAPVLTGLEVAELRAMGGLRAIDPNGAVLWEWPMEGGA